MVAVPSPWKHPKTGVYYFRRAVPAGLREALGWEVKLSLGTKDPKEAKRLFAEALQRSEETFEQAQNPIRLSEKQIKVLGRRGRLDADLKRLGNLRPTADEPSSATSGVRLGDLLERWSRDKDRPARTVREWRTGVDRFIALHGDLLVDQIRKAHIRDFKDHLVAQGKAAATIGKQLSSIRSVLQCGVDNGYLETNVAAGVKAPTGKALQRLPYDTTDLQRLFASPVFADGKRPKGGAGEAAYWLPVLALYTGARLEELGQAHLSDIRHDGGVLHLDINAEGEGKSLKTESSVRKVPLHPDLIALGFQQYVEGLRAKGETVLFPLVVSQGPVQQTSSWSKWWARYADELGLNDPRKVFHSFRHTFKDACRIAGIAEDLHDRLTGHTSSASVGRRYGNGPELLKTLAEGVSKIAYPGVVIPPWPGK